MFKSSRIFHFLAKIFRGFYFLSKIFNFLAKIFTDLQNFLAKIVQDLGRKVKDP